MRITDLTVETFGALRKLTITPIDPGLNVMAGPNGSGKTTLLEFIRAIFGGFERARRLSLVSDSKHASAGGSIGVEWGSRLLAVIRHNRTNEHETLAINVRRGRPEDAGELRKQLETLDPERLQSLFTSGAADLATIESLCTLARQDGIGLEGQPVVRIGNSPERSEMRRRRHSLLRSRDQAGRLSTLAGLQAELHRERNAARSAYDSADAEIDRMHQALVAHIQDTQSDIDSRHGQWQDAVSDLQSVEQRLWGRQTRRVVDTVFVQETQPIPDGGRNEEVAEIDRQLEPIRQVLKDVAASRHRVSVMLVDFAGAERFEEAEFHRRQRETLCVIEQQVVALTGTVRSLERVQSAGGCGCATVAERAGSIADELRRHVELSCQDLSRKRSAEQCAELEAERASLDQLEQHLRNQLALLESRRQSILNASRHAVRDRLAHAALVDRRFCECGEHTSTTRAASLRTVTRTTPQERLVEESSARPGDRELAQRLAAVVQLRRDVWQQAILQRNQLEHERLALVARRQRLFDQRMSLEQSESQLRAIETELDEARTEWRSLLVAESDLAEAEHRLNSDAQNRVMREASTAFETLTGERYRELRPSGQSLAAVDAAATATPLSLVSRGTLSQAALAMRLALIEEYARRGMEFPIVLDDVLVDCDEDRLARAAQVLHTAAANGRQILVLTCQERFAEMLAGHGARLHALSAIITTPVVIEPPPPASIELVVSTPEPLLLPQPAKRLIRLRPEDSLRLIPSMTDDAADHLESMGIRTVRQVLTLDRDFTLNQMTDLGFCRSLVTIWQPEADLLCRLPELDPPNAQLLVAVGIFSVEELASCRAMPLYQRIQRFRGSTPHVWHAWVQTRNTWPHQEELHDWITRAQDAAGTGPCPESFDPLSGDVASAEGPDDEPTPPKPGGSGDNNRNVRRNRGRTGRSARSNTLPMRRGIERAVAAEADVRFHLELDSAIVDAPSIGPKTSRWLQKAGILTVNHLLGRSAEEIARSIGRESLTAATIEAWQHQSRLMCQIAGLRGHDAQILVACGFHTPEAIGQASPATLLSMVRPFAESREGLRILRSSAAPDLNEVETWVTAARQARTLRAA